MIKSFLQSHGEYYDDKYFKDLTTLRMGGHIRHFVVVNTVDDLIQHALHEQFFDHKKRTDPKTAAAVTTGTFHRQFRLRKVCQKVLVGDHLLSVCL